MKQFRYHEVGLVPDSLFFFVSPWAGEIAVKFNVARDIEPNYYKTFKRYYADT